MCFEAMAVVHIEMLGSEGCGMGIERGPRNEEKCFGRESEHNLLQLVSIYPSLPWSCNSNVIARTCQSCMALHLVLSALQTPVPLAPC